MYTPPFRITAKILNLAAEISAKVERYALLLQQDTELRLRKANRIKTIHSSLAIEGNELTEGQVRDIINGKNVVAPLREIQEVKNAIATYDLFPTLNPFDERDLLLAHRTMMQALVDNPGRWRSDGVGVFGEKGCVHMAPPADRVPMLMSDLFGWLKNAEDHLLIRSCVFHYEFEFIHPFIDGNGRTGRLWQSLILTQLHPLFAHLPVENMVYSNQQAYYEAITASTAAGESTPFIEFMLGEILAALEKHKGEEIITEIDGVKFKSSFASIFTEEFARTFALTFALTLGKKIKTVANREKTFDACQQILVLMKSKESVNAKMLSSSTGVAERTVRTYLKQLSEAGIIKYTGTTNNGVWQIILSEKGGTNEA